MAVLLHERPQTAGGKTRKTPNLPKTSAVVALFAFSSRLDRDTMSLFAKTHSDEVRAAAIAATGLEVLEGQCDALAALMEREDAASAIAARLEQQLTAEERDVVAECVEYRMAAAAAHAEKEGI